jgi:uncharacterized membrane protein
MESTIQQTKSDWHIPTALIALSFVPVLAGIARLAQFIGGANITTDNARFFASPVPVLIHIPAVIAYSVLGAFQFSTSFRRRRRGWHRAAGRFLVVCGLVVALSGLWMARFYPWPPGDGQLLYGERLVAGWSMVLCIFMSLIAIGRRDFTSHGAWMMRAYTLALGAGTQVLTYLPWSIFIGGKPGETARAVMMGAGWMINVVVAEWIIRRGRVGANVTVVRRVV